MKISINFKNLYTFLLLTLVSFIFINKAHAQIPTTQDCLGAIAVCDYIYVEEYTATGYGNYYEIPTGQTCPNHCMDGEKNSRWYIFTVVQSGMLRFEITPQQPTDDYDWAVFNLTTYTCDDIWSHPTWMLSSCNAAGGVGYQGATGISSLNGGGVNCNNGGFTNKWNADLEVSEGETYVLVVSDWTQTPGGYTLDFSASTAVIFDDQQPYIEYIGGDLITACGTNELFVKFNENVKCSSIQPNDFKLSGPGGPYVIDSIFGNNCSIGGNNEREYTLYFTPAIYQGGDYTLEIRQFSFISDACNNYAQNETYDFFINLDSPTANAGEDIDIPYAATATLAGSATNGSGDYSYSWIPAELLNDPNIPTPTTVSLTTSTQFMLSVSDQQSYCVGEDTMWVNVVGGPLGITMSTSNSEICNGERVDLYVNPDGGGGDYTYSWSSNPVGFSSSEQNPSDFPSDNIWYIVNVTDGYTDITDSVYIIVNQLPDAFAGDDQIINQGTTTTLEGVASGGNGTYSYHWEPASWLESNNITDPLTLPLPAPTVFTLWVTDENGCESDPDDVLINASGGGLSAFLLAEPSKICIGQSTAITANASGGGLEYTYTWTSDPIGFTSTSDSIFVSPDVTTTYNLLLKDQYLTEVESSITITVDPLPEINLIPANANSSGDTITVCVRNAVTLDAGHDDDPSNTEYYWTKTHLANRLYTASTNGTWIDFQTHPVRVTSGSTGCINTDSVTVFFDFNECELGIPENSSNLSKYITIQPNPNNGSFVVNISKNIGKLNVSIFNTQSKIVFNTDWNDIHETIFSRRITTDLSPGIYFILFKSDDEKVMKKLVINRK